MHKVLLYFFWLSCMLLSKIILGIGLKLYYLDLFCVECRHNLIFSRSQPLWSQTFTITTPPVIKRNICFDAVSTHLRTSVYYYL